MHSDYSLTVIYKIMDVFTLFDKYYINKTTDAFSIWKGKKLITLQSYTLRIFLCKNNQLITHFIKYKLIYAIKINTKYNLLNRIYVNKLIYILFNLI